MTAEINLLIAARDHQADLLAEAEARRLTRRTQSPTTGSQSRTNRRLNTLLRRIAGAPTFA